jgi:RimJ/RimL family protein N-acetyltransferase
MNEWPLRTERLTIRRGTPEDAEATYRLRAHPAVSPWIPYSADTPQADFVAMYRSPERLPFFLVVERDGEMVGELLLRVEDSIAQFEVRERAAGTMAEIGWVIHPDHQRQGYASEACGRLLAHCFEDLGLHRVVAEAYAANEATAGLAPRLGFRLEATHTRAGLHRTHGWVDTVLYAILAEEWAAL